MKAPFHPAHSMNRQGADHPQVPSTHLDPAARPISLGDFRQRTLRVALYSHDTMGLGHMRRNALIARALLDSPLKPAVLLIAGAREASRLPLPQGADCITLPALSKDAEGDYHARSLPISVKALVALRASTILGAVTAFQPDVFIVDKVPRGALRELEPTLEYLRAHGRTHRVLGFRDILDDPRIVRQEWVDAAIEGAIRDFYDAIWVYGDVRVNDFAREYALAPDIVAKLRYVGYLDQQGHLGGDEQDDGKLRADLHLPGDKLIVCLLGGGQDGQRLATAFAKAAFPVDSSGVILAGPYLPDQARERLERRVAEHERLHIRTAMDEPTQLVRLADRVVAMGGYNTIGEVLSYAKPALIVPRIKPRAEQWIRARRLATLGLLDVLHPDHLSPAAIGEWLARAPRHPLPAREALDLDGLTRLPYLLAEVLRTAPSRIAAAG